MKNFSFGFSKISLLFSLGSDVKWYKGTSEWPIKPSKFFKPKSDGTKHQLYILEAYAEDEGQILTKKFFQFSSKSNCFRSL